MRANSANGLPAAKDAKYLTDTQRNEIDASAKELLRELNHAVTGLQETEQIRQQAENALAYKRRARQGLGALGRWAAGGAMTAKSPEEAEEEARANTLKAHRESIIWYLQRALEECSRFQGSMMEIRIMREVEKSKSMLYKARGTMPALEKHQEDSYNAHEESGGAVEQQLDAEQLQLFAQENQELLKQYEDHLDQVRYVSSRLNTTQTNCPQHRGKITTRDFRSPDKTCKQPEHAIGAH